MKIELHLTGEAAARVTRWAAAGNVTADTILGEALACYGTLREHLIRGATIVSVDADGDAYAFAWALHLTQPPEKD